MPDLKPYLPRPPASAGACPTLSGPGQAWEEVAYPFTNQESLVTHFSQWLPREWVVGLIEAEKQVFVVRKECSLEETRLQFLKKCEITLHKVLSQPSQAGLPDSWMSI